MQEHITADNLLIAVSGEHVGQVNRLAVIDLGDFMFAHRCSTATARIGRGRRHRISSASPSWAGDPTQGVMIPLGLSRLALRA
ncbi:MAG: hypothetical protein M5R42_01525 [Rhodocyclaceae bacterium]|nr:hypothetical protein [Rhodocyclaceae bacterium]